MYIILMSDNNQIYKILERSEKGSMYDKLICIKCNQTCMRCNFSRHKQDQRHIKRHDKNNEEYFNIKGMGSDGIFRDYGTKPEKINLLNEIAEKHLNDSGESKPIKTMKKHKDNKKQSNTKTIKQQKQTKTIKNQIKPIQRQTKQPQKHFIEESSDDSSDNSECEDIPYNKLTKKSKNQICMIIDFIDNLYNSGHYGVKKDLDILIDYFKGNTKEYNNMNIIMEHYENLKEEYN